MGVAVNTSITVLQERMWSGDTVPRHNACLSLTESTKEARTQGFKLVLSEKYQKRELNPQGKMSSGKRILSQDLGPCIWPEFLIMNKSDDIGL